MRKYGATVMIFLVLAAIGLALYACHVTYFS